jgi:hypothetical protein
MTRPIQSKDALRALPSDDGLSHSKEDDDAWRRNPHVRDPGSVSLTGQTALLQFQRNIAPQPSSDDLSIRQTPDGSPQLGLA